MAVAGNLCRDDSCWLLKLSNNESLLKGRKSEPDEEWKLIKFMLGYVDANIKLNSHKRVCTLHGAIKEK